MFGRSDLERLTVTVATPSFTLPVKLLGYLCLFYIKEKKTQTKQNITKKKRLPWSRFCMVLFFSVCASELL